MKIKLNEIPQEGREFQLNRSTGELNQALSDLIADHPYDIQFSITPLNKKDYEMRGTIKTSSEEICSLCGETFEYKIETPIHEILIEAAAPDKEFEKQSRSNHFSELNDSGPSVTEYKNDVLDAAELSHEIIALSIPFNPKHEANAKGELENCLKTNISQPFKYDEDMGVFEKAKEKENPFNVLKGIKLN